MPAIPTHLDLGIALLILGVLALLAFSPWFRRFALVCVALLVVAAGVVYMKINQENEQAMARECAPIPGQTIPILRTFRRNATSGWPSTLKPKPNSWRRNAPTFRRAFPVLRRGKERWRKWVGRPRDAMNILKPKPNPRTLKPKTRRMTMVRSRRALKGK